MAQEQQTQQNSSIWWGVLGVVGLLLLGWLLWSAFAQPAPGVPNTGDTTQPTTQPVDSTEQPVDSGTSDPSTVPTPTPVEY